MEMSDETQYIETILALKKKLEKGVSSDKTKHILYKLQHIPISINILERTGIGYQIRELARREKDNEIGTTAKLLTMGWKNFVRGKRNEDSEQYQQKHHHQQQSYQQDNVEASSSSSPGRHPISSPSSSPNNGVDIAIYNHSQEQSADNDNNNLVQESSTSSSSSSKKKHKHKKHKKSKSHSPNSDGSDDERRQGKKRIHSDVQPDSEPSSSSQREKSNNKNCESKRLKEDNLFGAMLGMADKIPAKHRRPATVLSSSSVNSTSSQSAAVVRSKVNPSSLSSASSSSSMGGSSSAALAPSSSSYRTSQSQVRKLSNGADPGILDSLTSDLKSRHFNNPYTSSTGTAGGIRKPLTNHSSSSSNRAVEEAFEIGRKSKHRTALFAGSSRSNNKARKFPSLVDICLRCLEGHIDQIDCVGDTPYEILKPVLQLCTPEQLNRIERFNPKLSEDFDELWKDICEKKFPTIRDKDDGMGWRDYYYNRELEQERKLMMISKRISQKEKAKTDQDRKAQEIAVKTPKEIRRRAEYAANPFFANRSKAGGPSGGAGGRSAALGGSGFGTRQTTVASAPTGPSKTPLMKKLLKMRNGR